MGLERVASVVQGVASNYDTDLFAPIHARMRELLGHDPEGFEAERFSYQVIADHSPGGDVPRRATACCPSNEGRGYVLRRIMRRAIRHGRLLGRTEPFLGETAKVVIDTMAGAYPHLAERRAEILGVIEREERQFNRTLEAGVGPARGGADPADLGGARRRPPGRDAARRRAGAAGRGRVPAPRHVRLPDRPDRRAGRRVRRAHGPRRVRGRARRAARPQPEPARRPDLAEDAPSWRRCTTRSSRRTGPTEFLGYETTAAEGRVVAILRDGIEYETLEAVPEVELRAEAGAQAELVLDRTPFYAESGGQVADTGVIRARRRHGRCSTVEDVQRVAGTQTAGPHRPSRHAARAGRGRATRVRAEVDAERRADTMRNHTGTHLLHRALRNVVGERARQAGSLVHPDYLRFDFPFDRAPDRRREAARSRPRCGASSARTGRSASSG